MDFGKLFNQVLDVAQKEFKNTANSNSTMDNITKVGGGAAVVGLLSMLLGRSGGSKLAKIGTLATLGSLAYKAYQSYQAKQNQPTVEEAAFSLQDNENVAKLILQTMIAAAASDGEISADEIQAINAEAGSDLELQQWLNQQMQHPATIAEISQKVGQNQVLAAQVYLAARVVCKDLSRKEVIFLANLAESLALNEQFVDELEKQAGF
nr:tellurite resistance TerB family protein [uncultured Haemophilus sp.]